jgi:thiol:disulfide interchange protein DsbA
VKRIISLFVSAAFTVALVLTSGAVLAKAFQEGTQYVPIQPQPAVTSGDEVEVVEFFWYGCPHCRDFEPVVNKWVAGLPDNVRFSQIPAMFGGAADMHAQVYYALQGMGELERMHQKLFDTMHVEKNKLRTREAVDGFLQANGVDMEKFAEAMNSFAVAAKVNRARALMRRYGVRSVPAMVVDGRYRSGTGFNSYEEITEVMDFVVDKVLKQRATQAGL